jgi:hypothetical protein
VASRGAAQGRTPCCDGGQRRLPGPDLATQALEGLGQAHMGFGGVGHYASWCVLQVSAMTQLGQGWRRGLCVAIGQAGLYRPIWAGPAWAWCAPSALSGQ